MKLLLEDLKFKLDVYMNDSAWHQEKFKCLEMLILETKELIAQLENIDGSLASRQLHVKELKRSDQTMN